MNNLHVGIIMDGNGRWAQARGWPRSAGHRVGIGAVRRIAEAAPRYGIGVLTLYAFSADNWRRPTSEVQTLMLLFETMLRREVTRCVRDGVRLSVIGRRDRLPPRLQRTMAEAESATRGGEALHLRLAIDYSARDAIVQAAAQPGAGTSRAAFAQALAGAYHVSDAVPDVDLVIRTGGEQRLSDFLLWECAYAELFFVPHAWPDFSPRDLAAVVEAFQSRERRFGALPAVAL